MSSSGQDPNNINRSSRNPKMILDPRFRMSQQSDEIPLFDYATEGLEQLIASDLSPAFGGPDELDLTGGLGGPQHATFSNNQPTSAQVHDRNILAFSYPTAVSSARGGFSPLNSVPYDRSQIFAGSTSPATYLAQSPIDQSPSYYQTGIEWQQSPASDSLYATEDGSAVSSNSNVNPYGYVAERRQPVRGSDPYMGDYVSPAASQDSSNLCWAGDTVMGNIDTTFPVPGNILESPVSLGYESPNRTPGAGLSESETGNPHVPRPQRKRTKKSPEGNIPVRSGPAASSSGYGKQPLLAPAQAVVRVPGSSGSSGSGAAANRATSASGGSHKSKLRSASRTSKNAVTRPSESLEERKTRNSHNLVEKQYRNRLNAQFESLLNALPETVRSPTGAGGGGSGGDSDGTGGAGTADVGERRLSKAEVLDMSRRYIQSLEKERDKLEQERGELQEDMARLRSVHERGNDGSGGGSLSGS